MCSLTALCFATPITAVVNRVPVRSTDLLSALSVAIVSEAATGQLTLDELVARVGGDPAVVVSRVESLLDCGVLARVGHSLVADVPTFEHALGRFA